MGGGNYFFKGSGLDIGEKVKVEWALGTQKGDSLHKIGKGELVITTQNNASENLGYLKIGEGKVTLDTDKKAFEGIYITSGRGELALVKDKAEALGATKNGTTSANTINSGATSATSYKLAQDSTDKMGFYFGKGGGKFDLAGNSLVLNTIAANDSKAIITNSNTSTQSTLEIEGLGYANGTKTQNKADTIIHASIGDNANGTNSTPANLNLIHQSNVKTDKSLIFDGNININGKLNTTNSNIVLQGHPTTHATISNADTINKIKNAESGTGKPMPDYMDLSKPSNLKQPDWDSRNFSITGGIDLKNATLTVGKAAHLKANINADSSSQINFGGRHFIDSKDGKNVIGSGFSYQQGVTSGDLTNETYKDSSYSGKITADGTTITSKFANFAPNLELSNNASLNAKYLTLTQSSTMNLTNSTAKVENLIFKDFTNNNFASKFTLNDSSKFEVKESLSFDKSTFNLDTLKTRNNITLPMAYNLYVFNDSNITATTFTNTKENAQFIVQNSSFTADKITFEKNAFMTLDNGKLTLTNGLETQGLNLNLSNSSTLNAKTLTSTGVSTINLNDKATLTLENALTSKNLSVNASNQSKFTANTLTASGVVNLNADTNSNIQFSTLNLQNGNLQNISQNVDFTTLNLTQSKANLELLNGQIPKTIDLKTQSNLYLKELNFNTNNIKLTSDDSSKAYIKRLIYDASNARANSTNTALQSNIVISEKFELKNVGQNLSTTTGTQNTLGAPSTPNTDDEKLQKDLFTLKFDKNLELGNGASLDISFADKVTKDNKDLLFNKDYTIFSANSLTSSNHLQVDFKNSNGTSFGETDFYIKGKLDKDKNAFSVQFVRENPRNFSELNPHIDPSYSPFLEILLQHNDFDKSVDKAVNLSDYSALQERLISLDKSFKDVANSSSNVLETLPLLQRHNINKRIQNQRFTGAKYAYNEERYNPLQKSDFIPALLYLDKMEKEERVWSNVGGGYFTKDESKMSLQSVSVGYDKKLLSNEFLFGVMASITQMQLSHSADEFKQNPQIYSLTFYSNALFGDDELQNELGFSFFNDKRHIGDEELSAGGVGTFFNSLYKFKLSFLPQNFKPLILANVNFNSLNAIDTPTYIQKSYKDLSFDVGLGFELDFEKENGFYNISFIAQQDIYHSKDEVLVSLAKSDKFIPYKSNDPSLSYQLRLMGLENFNNGMFLRYSLSGFIDTKAYKGVSADIQLGYKY
ncbi:anti-codon nuclease masking agent [Campylobacter jejuni subsp. doylei]|nr:anti-codon nuclease masking agent [Campylobacter jejuni subsp. doylei]